MINSEHGPASLLGCCCLCGERTGWFELGLAEGLGIEHVRCGSGLSPVENVTCYWLLSRVEHVLALSLWSSALESELFTLGDR